MGKSEKGQQGECKIQTEQMKENKGSNSKLSTKEGKDADYPVQQGTPDNTMNIIDLTITPFNTKSLDNNKEKTCKNVIQNERSKEYNEKELQVSFKEKPLEKQEEEEDDDDDINGEFDHTLMEENIDNRSNLSMKENKDEDDHLNKGIVPESTKFKSLFDLCEVIIQNEIYEKHDGSKTTKDQEDSIKEKLPDQQQQQDITGESELNKVIGEDSLSNNSDRVLNDNVANCGSKLLIRDENNGNYRITQGIPRSTKFRSINNLYKCTIRLSPVEDEYNWNCSRGKDSSEDSNTNHLKNKDSRNKKNFDCKRKCRENQKGNKEKDAMT